MRSFLKTGSEKTRTAVGLLGMCGPSLRSLPEAGNKKTRTATGILALCGPSFGLGRAGSAG